MYIAYIYNIAEKMTDDLPDFHGFQWDKGNSCKNLVKHDVSDGECEEIFFNEPIMFLHDVKHSGVENRFAAFGVTNSGRLLTVVFTGREKLIRVISARDMNRKERGFYKKYEKDPKV